MIKTIQTLVKQLNQYRNEYYNDNNPTVSQWQIYKYIKEQIPEIE